MSEEKKKQSVEKEAEIVTIHDFKAMLIGLDLALGDEWTPNEDQWKRIRKKIDALIETAERPGGGNRPPRYNPVDLSSGASDAFPTNFPTVPSGIPGDVPIGEAGPAGPSALAPPQPTPQATVPRTAPIADGRDKVKTPDIDSSAGYKSQFV